MSSTIILFASSRRNGNTGQLTDSVAKKLGLDVMDLSETNISAFDYEHRNRSDDFEPFINTFKETFSYLEMDFGGFLNANCINGYKAELYQNDIKAFIEKF